MKLAAFTGVAALAVTAGVVLATSPSSSAINCPRGTVPFTTWVAGRPVGACKPGTEPECDPAECPATAVPSQD